MKRFGERYLKVFPAVLCALCYLVVCVNARVNGDLRLVSDSGFTGGTSGRLEVFQSGTWWTVCNDGFDYRAAKVSCKQLGFSSYSKYGSVGSLSFNRGSPNQRIWLDNFLCSGSESRLYSCSRSQFSVPNCDHGDDVGLICSRSSSGNSNGDNTTIYYGSGGGSSGFVILLVCCCICVCCGSKKRSRSRTTFTSPRTAVAQPQTGILMMSVTHSSVKSQSSTLQPESTAYPMEEKKSGLYPDAPPAYPGRIEQAYPSISRY